MNKNFIFLIVLLSANSFAAKSNKSDAKNIYVDILKSYQNEDLKQLGISTRSLHLSKDNQAFIDNAYYLLGRLQLKKGLVSQALTSFNTVEKKFPESNKRVSAIYAKANLYKRIKLNNLAKKTMLKVMNWYPGSLEAKRAKMEIKTL